MFYNRFGNLEKNKFFLLSKSKNFFYYNPQYYRRTYLGVVSFEHVYPSFLSEIKMNDTNDVAKVSTVQIKQNNLVFSIVFKDHYFFFGFLRHGSIDRVLSF